MRYLRGLSRDCITCILSEKDTRTGERYLVREASLGGVALKNFSKPYIANDIRCLLSRQGLRKSAVALILHAASTIGGSHFRMCKRNMHGICSHITRETVSPLGLQQRRQGIFTTAEQVKICFSSSNPYPYQPQGAHPDKSEWFHLTSIHTILGS